ncbi:hypothetical protein SipoB123_00415 [Streptomyces ipomoeae]|nr:hypothetical protein SipoB123_00415 [Streptomyces ipomoeae]
MAHVTSPSKYPPESRERAVRMSRATEPGPVIRRVADDLGVHPEALRATGRGKCGSKIHLVCVRQALPGSPVSLAVDHAGHAPAWWTEAQASGAA